MSDTTYVISVGISALASMAVMVTIRTRMLVQMAEHEAEKINRVIHATGHQRNDMFAWRPDTGWPGGHSLEEHHPDAEIQQAAKTYYEKYVPPQREWKGGIVHPDQVESYRQSQRGQRTTPMSVMPRPAPTCAHTDTVNVDLSTGEVVARICLSCDDQLPATAPPPGRITTQ